MQLIIEGKTKQQENLQSTKIVQEMLEEYPGIIKMQKIKPPTVFFYKDPNSEISGVSGLVWIVESHIVIDTYPTRDYVKIDISSCRDFPLEPAIAFAKKKLELYQIETTLIVDKIKIR